MASLTAGDRGPHCRSTHNDQRVNEWASRPLTRSLRPSSPQTITVEQNNKRLQYFLTNKYSKHLNEALVNLLSKTFYPCYSSPAEHAEPSMNSRFEYSTSRSSLGRKSHAPEITVSLRPRTPPDRFGSLMAKFNENAVNLISRWKCWNWQLKFF
jgi:hypothetical protein